MIPAAHTHAFECYGLETLPCPKCPELVRQTRLQCGPDSAPSAECTACSMACPDCPAEVRITEGAAIRIRVIHAGTCPWYARWLAKQVVGRIPCGAVVTHRGPYKNRPAA